MTNVAYINIYIYINMYIIQKNVRETSEPSGASGASEASEASEASGPRRAQSRDIESHEVVHRRLTPSHLRSQKRAKNASNTQDLCRVIIKSAKVGQNGSKTAKNTKTVKPFKPNVLLSSDFRVSSSHWRSPKLPIRLVK